MNRNVIVKHTTNPADVTTNFFLKGLPSGLTNDQKKQYSRGILVVCNKSGKEALYILNTKDEPTAIAMSCEGELPPNVEAAILNAISSLSNDMEEHIDNSVGERIDESLAEYNAIVVESGTTLYNTIIDYVNSGFTETNDRIDSDKEELLGTISALTEQLDSLRTYVENLKFSDHVLIKENAYSALTKNGYVYIDEDGNLLDDDDPRYGNEEYKVIYDDSVYYCIPEDGYTPGPTPPPVSGDSSVEISGSVMTVDFDIISGHTLVVDDTISISGTTMIISGSSHGDDEDEDEEIIDETFIVGDDSEIDEHTLSLPSSNRIENNTLII